MSNEFVKRVAAALLVLLAAIPSASSEQQVFFRKSLTATERHCLEEMLRSGHWRVTPQFHHEMIAAAVVARPELIAKRQKQYIFVITDFASCGTAGCSMLIGEPGKDGICREIYSGSGFVNAISVLPERDHGYRRLYTPCELRFDGREYQQVREECPSLNVQR